MTITNFRDLDVWNVAMELAMHIYDAVKKLPPHERFEMSGQMRRAAVSIPSNVAEGHATGLRKRYRHHVRISLGSLGELMTCVELARRLDYLSDEEAQRLQADMERTSQLLHGVLRNIRRQLAVKGIVGILLLTCVYSMSSLFGSSIHRSTDLPIYRSTDD